MRRSGAVAADHGQFYVHDAAASWSWHMRTVAQRFASSARGARPRVSAGSMTKARCKQDDDLRLEYGFASLKGSVRGKYYRRFQAGSNIARLEPDLAKVFPTDEAVNEALRTVVRASRAPRRSTRRPNK
jgi:hypothetical protein